MLRKAFILSLLTEKGSFLGNGMQTQMVCAMSRPGLQKLLMYYPYSQFPPTSGQMEITWGGGGSVWPGGAEYNPSDFH